MSEAFLGRWARRKAAARPREAEGAEPVAPELPAVETLTAGSDFAVFLQKGVAAGVQQAALAVAWRSDPVIAGFRGMADYDWDFNAPGYGMLRAGDDVAKLVRAVLAPPLPEAVVPVVVEAEPVVAGGDAEAVAVSAIVAAEPEPAEDVLGPRRHGSALPA